TGLYASTRDRPAGAACTSAPRAGLRTLGGAPVAGGPFAFSTGGPAVVSATPGADGEIAGDQVSLLEPAGAVAPASFVEHAAFAVQGFPERVPVRLVEGAERDAILGTLDDWQREEPLVVVAARPPVPNTSGGRRALGARAAVGPGAPRETSRRGCAGRSDPRSPPSSHASARTPPAAARRSSRCGCASRRRSRGPSPARRSCSGARHDAR